ncbi:MAG: WecB/TagA/CpsF family glycosyltransferase [Cyanobacteria bacterium P01_A01_bin.37]
MINQQPHQLEKKQVLGLPLHITDDYSEWVLQQIGDRRGLHVITLNAEMSMQAEQDAALAKTIHDADLIVPDGSGVVLYFWLRGQQICRCPGIELAEKVLQGCPSRNASVFFIGGKPGITDTAAQVWTSKVPELAIAGTQHGYFSHEDEHHICQVLEDSQPAVILVGLGVPRQEFWIQRHRHRCPDSVWIGVGGSFDIWAGVKDRAPEWFCNNHLEWMYRLYQEPWRWKRMLALPKFAWKALNHSRSSF